MNKVKKILGIVLIGLVLGGQFYFYMEVYPRYQETLLSLEQDIVSQEASLKVFEEGLKRLPKSKEELGRLQLEVVSLIERMPSYNLVSKDLSQMMSMLEGNQFINIKMDSGEAVTHEYEGHTFLERQYTLRYTAPFSESKAFIERLNESYQLINVSEFITDNQPQVDQQSKEAYQLLYGEKFKELVETTVTFSLFINPSFAETEVYDPTMNVLVDSENAFRNLEGVGLEEEEREPLSIPSRVKETYMELLLKEDGSGTDYVMDLGKKGGEEIKMTSKDKMNVYITLDEEVCQVVLRDSKGREVSQEVIGGIQAPILKVVSENTGENTQPEVNIYIENYTKEVVVVDIVGKMLGNLHIYNEQGIEVHRGGIKGKVIVR